MASIGGLSAHADAPEIVGWLRRFTHVPEHTYVVHGEADAAAAMATRIAGELGWRADVASLGAGVGI